MSQNISLNVEKTLSVPDTASIIKEGFSKGMIEKRKIEDIQTQILMILKDLIQRYTNGESSSVTIETAEKLLNSICFSIDACTAGYIGTRERIDLLLNGSITELYEKGLEIVSSYVAETKKLYYRIIKTRLNVPVEAYNLTIDDFPIFFNKYSIVFGAHDAPSNIDYPLMFDNSHLKGVFYMKQYMENLLFETEICSHFDNREILKLLACYGKVYSIDYKKTLLNICELVINNSIFSVIAGSKADRLTITEQQYESISKRLLRLNKEKTNTLLNEACEKMIHGLEIEQSKTITYIKIYMPELASRVTNAVKNNCLQNLIIITEGNQSQQQGIIYEEGERMSDAKFRTLTSKIMKCGSTREKINLIKSGTQSAYDFIDILEADCLFEDEYTYLFASLNDIDLAVLGKTVFNEELRSGIIKLDIVISEKANTDINWQAEYLKFLHNLEPTRLIAIERFINKIQIADESI
ncbi:MAG: DUF6179 domain-containing protein [Bacillota bacterium]|nr:DUF6179 domain-containing protein [Bacillota bacterium]